jgi:acyl carrier protein
MKTLDAVREEAYAVIAEALNISAVTIRDDALVADLSADSIQLFELLLAFERFYEIETAYDDVVRLHTVGDIVEYIGRVKYGI